MCGHARARVSVVHEVHGNKAEQAFEGNYRRMRRSKCCPASSPLPMRCKRPVRTRSGFTSLVSPAPSPRVSLARSLVHARALSLALSVFLSHARTLALSPCICTRCRCVRQVEAQRHPRALRVLSMSRGIACALKRIQVGKMTLSLALVPAPAARGARGLRGARGRGAGNEGERARGACVR